MWAYRSFTFLSNVKWFEPQLCIISSSLLIHNCHSHRSFNFSFITTKVNVVMTTINLLQFRVLNSLNSITLALGFLQYKCINCTKLWVFIIIIIIEEELNSEKHLILRLTWELGDFFKLTDNSLPKI